MRYSILDGRRELEYGIKPYADLRDADLHGAYLRDADLRGADLRSADLRGADLRDADLRGADLRDADLYLADLCGADLRDANLRGANLYIADLCLADLCGADLRDANLRGAVLRDANLRGAYMDPFLICPELGYFEAFKKASGHVFRIAIDATTQRAGAIGSRKCRAAMVRVLECMTDPTVEEARSEWGGVYRVGEEIVADGFDIDPRTPCTQGIHFFMTEQEARNW